MKKYEDIFKQTDCISEEMLVKYVSGKLSPADKLEIEKHLIDCEMCSEAVEGLAMISGEKKISENILELNQKIRRRMKKNEVKIIFFRKYQTQMAIAASILAILGMVWFFQNNMSMNERDISSSAKIFADKIEPYRAEKEGKDNMPVTGSPASAKSATEASTEENTYTNPKDGTSDQAKKNVEKSTSVSSRFLKEEPKNKVKLSKPVVSQFQGAAGVLNKSDNASQLHMPEKSRESLRTQPGVKSVPPPITNSDATMDPNEGIVNTDSTREKLTPWTTDATVAMQEYDQKNYSGAAENFEKVLANDPTNYNALFYASVSYLSTGRMDKAITNLNKVLEKKNGEFYDDAQWYLSLAYIKKSDLQNGRKILMDLQKNHQSKYQKQAEETLRNMNK